MTRTIAPLALYHGRRALVLGASGFIGRWVARALQDAGAHVTALVRDPVATGRTLAQWGVTAELVLGDLTDHSGLAALIDRAAPDITFNLAGYGIDRAERDDQLLQQINAELPGTLAGVLAKRPATWEGFRLIHTGSALEYGEIGGRLEESGPVNPTTAYGITKLEGTRAVERCGFCPAFAPRKVGSNTNVPTTRSAMGSDDLNGSVILTSIISIRSRLNKSLTISIFGRSSPKQKYV